MPAMPLMEYKVTVKHTNKIVLCQYFQHNILTTHHHIYTIQYYAITITVQLWACWCHTIPLSLLMAFVSIRLSDTS